MCIQKIYPKLGPKVLSKKKNKRTLVQTCIGCTNILSHYDLFHELVKRILLLRNQVVEWRIIFIEFMQGQELYI
jgi:hypothetical protein